MQKLTLRMNTSTAVLFAAFFAYTFLAKAHLQSLARDFVTQKTLSYSAPVIDTVEDALDVPLLIKLVSADDVRLVRDEVSQYRNNPEQYVADLTHTSNALAVEINGGTMIQKAEAAKQRIRDFYDKTLAALIGDLRIFSATNTVAACLAILLTMKSLPPIRTTLVAFSFLLFVAVVFCSYLYVDDMSFFRILTASHMGWQYPVLVAVVASQLYKHVGPTLEACALSANND